MTWIQRERDLWAVWEAQRWENQPLGGLDDPIEVVHRGRWSAGDGPDFRDALLADRSGNLLRGDVELHLRAASWREHGHADDPAYNAVVLHAVLDNDAPTTVRGDGVTVRTLTLRPHLPATPPPARLPEPNDAPPTVDDVLVALRRIGEQRFFAKSARFGADLAVTPPVEVLWRGVLDGLGYSRNRAPFVELAKLASWSILEIELRHLGSAARACRAAAILLGLGGWLDGVAPLAVDDLLGEWRGFADRWAPARVILPWNARRTRPENAPIRRAAAAAMLAATAAPTGLMSHLLQPFRRANDGAPTADELEAPLLVAESASCGSWLAALEAPTARGALLGADRAAEIVVNTVLPFAHAWADLFGQGWLGDSAFDAYRFYRRLAGNEISRHIAGELGVVGPHARRLGACHEQGLLQVATWLRTGDFGPLAAHNLLGRLTRRGQLELPGFTSTHRR